jgi:hypothetical protein
MKKAIVFAVAASVAVGLLIASFSREQASAQEKPAPGVLKWEYKDCHVGIGNTAKYGRCTGRSMTVFFARARGSCWGTRTSLSRWGNHLLARLVHQGSDPTLPYQALVIRESAKL